VGDRIVARFSYSAQGTDAMKGEAVGTLDIYEVVMDEGSSSEDEGGGGTAWTSEMAWVETVIAGAELVVQHWRAMGKHFKNTVRPSRCSVYGIEAASLSGGGTPVTSGFGAYGF
jgi:hypothetical protein